MRTYFLQILVLLRKAQTNKKRIIGSAISNQDYERFVTTFSGFQEFQARLYWIGLDSLPVFMIMEISGMINQYSLPSSPFLRFLGSNMAYSLPLSQIQGFTGSIKFYSLPLSRIQGVYGYD